MIEKIKNEEIWRHWENKAKSNSDYTATGPDYNLRDLEVFKISRYLKKNNFVIDFGCGTGRATYEYSKKVKEIVGIDFSPSMIDIAKSRYKNPNLKFAVGDILNPQKFDKLADVIMTTRCIINLTSWLEQKKAIKNMINLLKSSGTLILAETFEEPFSGCDKTRKKFGLKPLERPWHNKFLRTTYTSKDIFSLRRLFSIKVSCPSLLEERQSQC